MKKQFKFWMLITLLGFSVSFVTGCGNTTPKDATSTPQVNTQQGSTPSSTSAGGSTGEADYTQNCATCHESPPPTKNLQQITNVVNSGKGRMPSFKGKLSAGQIQAIANYIVSE
ncbi:MAG: cytochrome c [Desulfosporosinus sp.]|nr:cytochrome c [Desulfosporosinus sp.]